VEKELGTRPVLHGTAEELRGQFAGLGQFLATQYPPPSPAVKADDHDIGGIRARVYTPRDPHNEPLPVAVYAHGGGFVLGNLDTEDPLCRAVVENTRSIIVSIEYRLAPEHRAPAQIDDMVKGFEWVNILQSIHLN
jgi:versiconal hemiacetal acetate esterase